jgi:hypothetical protein
MSGAEQREAQPGEPHTVGDWPVRALLGGLLVSVIELGVALSGNTWSLFLGDAERDAYVGLALLTGVGTCTLVFGLGVLLRRVSADPVWRGRLMGGLAFAACLVVLYLLSDGRRVRDSALRWPVVALLAGGAGVAVMKASPWLEARARAGGSVALAGLFTALSCGAAAADATLLLRLYPAFHVALAVLVVLGASLAAWLLPLRLARLRQHSALPRGGAGADRRAGARGRGHPARPAARHPRAQPRVRGRGLHQRHRQAAAARAARTLRGPAGGQRGGLVRRRRGASHRGAASRPAAACGSSRATCCSSRWTPCAQTASAVTAG